MKLTAAAPCALLPVIIMSGVIGRRARERGLVNNASGKKKFNTKGDKNPRDKRCDWKNRLKGRGDGQRMRSHGRLRHNKIVN